MYIKTINTICSKTHSFFPKPPTLLIKFSLIYFFLVTVPPEKPVIYDQRGFKVGSISGAYEENTDVTFVCRVYNGK